MANAKARINRLEERYGGALRGEIDFSLMSYNELLGNISNMLVDVGVHPDEAEKQISYLRMEGFGDEKLKSFEVQNYRAKSRNYSELSNDELKDEFIRAAARLGIEFPDFEVV
jgi:hypothetical protein